MENCVSPLLPQQRLLPSSKRAREWHVLSCFRVQILSSVGNICREVWVQGALIHPLVYAVVVVIES